RQVVTAYHQRVVAGDGEGIGQAGEYSLITVIHRTGLAVHGLAGTHHLAAEGLADALVAEADAQDRQPAGKVLEYRHRYPSLVGRAGAGGDDYAFGLQRFDLGHAQLIVAHHLDLGTQLAEVLHQIPGEGIVVVDHQYHAVPLTAWSSRPAPPHGTWRGAC